ncbi:MAG: DUF3050 domain-containing protein [Phycisphaeraceae bacterium]|nr:DUF3050 domain-containing protein [Phycisphaeraceae bacterium]
MAPSDSPPLADPEMPFKGILDALRVRKDALSVSLVAEADRVANHHVYSMVVDLESARAFMEHHVWCVWDFMMLAKSVQVGLGCYELLWVPPADTDAVAAINAIIADEEADIGPDGLKHSHFEIYLGAMKEAGASTRSIDAFLSRLRITRDLIPSMLDVGATPPAVRFVQATYKSATGPIHARVAALCLAREELVPRLLSTLLTNLPNDSCLSMFRWYIERHIQVDSATHGPLSATLYSNTVRNDAVVEREALESAIEAIRARGQFLDSIADALARVASANTPSSFARSKV